MLNWIHTLWDYNYWGHHKILDCLDTINEADFKRAVDYSIGSLHQQIVHVMWAEDVWYARLHDMPRPTYTTDDYPTRDSIRTKWVTTEALWREYLKNLTDTALNRELDMTRLNGQTLTHSVMEIMLHIPNHGTDHRSQMLQLIHGYGGETFAQDMVFYFREKRGDL